VNKNILRTPRALRLTSRFRQSKLSFGHFYPYGT